MSFAHYLKEIGPSESGGRDLSERDAYHLFGALLDGGVPDLEVGAILLAMRLKTEGLDELLGFHRAASERVHLLHSPNPNIRPIVIPTYKGTRHQANLLPLVALLLQRFGVPVLLHGTLEGNGSASSAYILRELEVMPQPSLRAAQNALDEENLAFVPTGVLSPGLANLMGLRHRLGMPNSAHTVVKLIEPFTEKSVRMVSASQPSCLEKFRDFFSATGATALLMCGTEGECFANPKLRPRIECFNEGRRHVLFEAEIGSIKAVPALPASNEAITTAAWIRDCLAGRAPIPYPIVNQLACCLYACGYTNDLNQAKAIAALQPSLWIPHPSQVFGPLSTRQYP